MDDDECLRELLNLHLWQAGYDVRLAEDAIEAGRMVLKAVPDLMIVDINLPYMNGFEFVAAVRADRTIPFFPVLFLTADKGAVIRSREFGAACLLKPVQADKFLLTVASNVPNQLPQSLAAQPELSPAG
ncbi:MAG TPA: response regulator [Burkholderiales bacterium]|nr:response regulator [Burkholderiales bacterium]